MLLSLRLCIYFLSCHARLGALNFCTFEAYASAGALQISNSVLGCIGFVILRPYVYRFDGKDGEVRLPFAFQLMLRSIYTGLELKGCQTDKYSPLTNVQVVQKVVSKFSCTNISNRKCNKKWEKSSIGSSLTTIFRVPFANA